jgi:hypothetical protein
MLNSYAAREVNDSCIRHQTFTDNCWQWFLDGSVFKSLNEVRHNHWMLTCCHAVATTLTNAISQRVFTWATPASSPSAALWASFGSSLDARLSTVIASWTCGQVPADDINRVAVSCHCLKPLHL